MTDLAKELRDLAARYRVRPTLSADQYAAEMTGRETATLVAALDRAATALDRPGDEGRLSKDDFVGISDALLHTPPAEPSEAQVEAAARALCNHQYSKDEGPAWDDFDDDDDEGREFHDTWRGFARAAIVAAGVTRRPGVEEIVGQWRHTELSDAAAMAAIAKLLEPSA